MLENNFILTGVPRSGSTLLLKLVSNLNENLCLDEPKWLKQIRQENILKSEIPNSLIKHLNSIRKDILELRPIDITYQKNTEEIPSNHFSRNKNGTIFKTKETKSITLKPSLKRTSLVIKSNIFFTAILKELIDSNDFKIIATIRDPVAIIKSWRSLDFSLSKGRAMIAEKYSNEVKQLSKEKDLLTRQVILLDWMFRTYHINKNKIQIIKYEDIINEPNIIKDIFPNWENNNNIKLKSMNKNSFYNHIEEDTICQAIRKHSSYIGYYYSDFQGGF